MSLLEPSPSDAARRSGLRRMRAVATGLLLLAALVYLLTLGAESTWLGYVNAAAEAAMVGALADWFAVTALFRHPLGIPVPHTAIIAKRKNEIGRNLEEFVTDNFLTDEIARERLTAARVGERLGTWLGELDHRDRIMREVVRVTKAGLARLDDDEVRSVMDQFVLPRLAEEPISPIAGAVLADIVRDGAHRGLVDLALAELSEWLGENPGTYAVLLGDRAPWWTPPWIDEKVIGWSYTQVIAWLRDIQGTPEHPALIALDDLLKRLARDLQEDTEVMERAEALKSRLLAHPQVPDLAVGLWQSFRAALLTAMDDPDSYFHRRGDELLAHFGQHLVQDEQWRNRLEAYLGDAVAFFVNTYGSELASVISVTVEKWDAREASARIELHVGRDLQFIRINGTIVGALAGLAIHGLSQLAGG